jgi:catalase
MTGEAMKMDPGVAPIDLEPSPALRLYGKYKPTLKGRKVGVLLGTGFDTKLADDLIAAIEKEGATPAIIAAKAGGAMDSGGNKRVADMALRGSPSILFDAVAILAGADGDSAFAADPDAVGFLMDACRHLKAIGQVGISALLKKAHVGNEIGVTELHGKNGIANFLDFAREGKVWAREPE